MEYPKELVNIFRLNTSFTISEILGVLYLVNKDNYSLNKLVQKTAIPSKSLSDLLKTSSFYISNTNQKYLIKPTGKKISKLFKKHKFKTQIKVCKTQVNFAKSIRKLHKSTAKRQYDQFYATPKTTVKKAKIVRNFGLTKNTNIALVGDDDLVSLVLSKFYKNISNITVFEIDEDIINTINKVKEKHNLTNLQVTKADVKNTINTTFFQKFDVVLTDPPYTANGVDLFLNRSVALLKNGGVVFLNYGNSFKNPSKIIAVQKVINKYNLVNLATYKNFNTYNGAYTIGASSNVYIYKKTNLTPIEQISLTNIYTHQIKTNINFPYTQIVEAKLTNVPSNILSKQNVLNSACRQFAKTHNLKIVNEQFLKFGKGLTINYTLLNSSFTAHSWPEYNALHLVIVSCKQLANKGLIYSSLQKNFKTDLIEVSFG